MTEVRSIEAYSQAMSQLMPRGRIWPEGGGPVWAELTRAVSGEFRRADARLLRLLEEADPRTCGETLEDWERVLGLPDPCSPGDASITERRNAVVAKLKAVGGASRAYFTELASDLGYAITIFEYRQVTCGQTRCGDSRWTFGQPRNRFYWRVRMNVQRLRYFRTGDDQWRTGRSRLGEISRAIELECILDRLKPAQTDLIFDYSETGGI